MKLRVGLILATMVLVGMLLSGVVLAQRLVGGPGHNNYMGTKGTDYIYGGAGADDLGGKEGVDYIFGQPGNDRMHGGRGRDTIDGGRGTDTAWGDEGKDDLTAEFKHYKASSIQAAEAKGGRKPDKLLGGDGKDTIRAKNGKRDIIRGGPGRDKAYVDPRVDKVTGVEVKPAGNSPPVAAPDEMTVPQDDNGTTIDVLANDTDIDGGPKTIESFMEPANGDVYFTNFGNDIAYEPNSGYCNDPPPKGTPPGTTSPDTFTYTINGGSTAPVAVTVTCTP